MKQIDTSADAPWKQRFRVTTAAGQVAAGNKARGLAVSNRSGVLQLYAWDVASGELRQLTHTKEGRSHGVIGGDGEWVYYLDDKQGNELGHYVRLPFAGGEPEDITPDMPLYASFSFGTSHDGRTLGFTTADATGFHVYTITAAANGMLSLPKLIYEARVFSSNASISADGSLMLVETTDGMNGLNFRVLAFDLASGKHISTLSNDPDSSMQGGAFAPRAGDTRVLMHTNHSGTTRPLIWDVRTGERIDLALGELAGDVEPQGWSTDGEHVLLLQVSQAVHQLYRYTVATGVLTRLEHPSGTFFGAYHVSPEEIFANWQKSTNPAQVIALDNTTGKQTRVVLEAGQAPPARPWRSISFPTTGGETIQGWLVTPEGQGPFPTILETHGGPTFAMTDLFHSGSQAWVDHGWAFVSINYRGSTTFGREFEQKIWGDLGHWEVDDMVAARDYLVRENIAEADSVLLTGWSYGGYLTLQALGKTPKLWAGGMAGIAIADWAMQYEDSADTLKGYQVALLGGTPEQQPDVYRAASPITYAQHVAAPVLVIQGSNDTRCPARPMRAYESKLRELGKQIEVVWFEAGHGSYVVEQSIEHQELMLRFANQVVG